MEDDNFKLLPKSGNKIYVFCYSVLDFFPVKRLNSGKFIVHRFVNP